MAASPVPTAAAGCERAFGRREFTGRRYAGLGLGQYERGK
jgi:hypothetical protein